MNPPAFPRPRKAPFPTGRWVLIGVGLILLFFIGRNAFHRLSLSRKIAARLVAIGKAGYPVTLAELNHWYTEVPDEENAAQIYARAFSGLSLSSTNSAELPVFGRGKLPPRTAPLSDESKKAILDLLAMNRATLELLHEGAARWKCRYPIDMMPGVRTLLPHLLKLKKSSELLELDALMRAEAGDLLGATRAIEELWALAESLAQEPILISQLVRIASEEMALSSIERIMNRQRFSPDQLADLIQMLNVDRNDAALRRGWIGERCFGLAMLHMPSGRLASFMNDPAQGGETGGEWSVLLGLWFMRISGHLDRDELFFLESTDSYIRAIDVRCPERLQLSGAVSRNVAQVRLHRKGGTRPFIISGLLLPSIGKVFEKVATHSAHCRTAAVSLSLEQYRLRHKDSLPSGLEELVPTWAGQIPTDPFDGRPLRYKRLVQGYVVYSIGADCEDNDGSERRPLSNVKHRTGVAEPAFDITFTVER